MRVTVVYRSSAGSTEQYAKWLAEEFHTKPFDLQWVSGTGIREDDILVYGGYVIDGRIVGYERISSYKVKAENFIVFAVGAAPDSPETRTALKLANNIGDRPFFYLQGRLNTKKMRLMNKSVYKRFKKRLANRTNKTRQDMILEETMSEDFDNCKRENLEPIIKHIMYILQKELNKRK